MENNGYEHLGYFSLSLLYFCLGTGCLVSTAVMNKIGAKYCMMAGSICDSIWILCSIFPFLKSENPDSESIFNSNTFIYISTAICAICDGFGGAIQWVA